MSVSPAPGRDPARAGRRGLEQPERRGSDRDHPAAGGARRRHRLGGLGADLAPFARASGARRCSRPSPAGRCRRRRAASAARAGDPPGREVGEEARVEVERGGRRRHRARPRRRRPSGSPRGRAASAAPPGGDVGRQRHLADAPRAPPRAPRRSRSKASSTSAPSLSRTSAASPAPKSMRSPTASRLPGRASARQTPSGAAAISVASIRAPAPPARRRTPVEPRRDHPGVVEDQEIAALAASRRAAPRSSRAMRRGPGDQQPRRRARPRRAERDQLLGQLVVEVVEAHGARYSARPV